MLRTYDFETLPKPAQSDHGNYNVDEFEVCDDGYGVDEYLLVDFEFLDTDARRSES
jgi:hypothetical protein